MILSSKLNGLPIISSPVIRNIAESGFIQDVNSLAIRHESQCDICSTILQGQTISRTYAIGGNSLDNWSCLTQIRDIMTKALIYSSVVSDTSEEINAFLINIPKEVTEVIEEGQYMLGTQFDNSLTGESFEVLERFKLEEQWVYQEN